MAMVSRGQLVADIREYMDSTGSGRWNDSLIKAVANSVLDAEWSEILNAAPYYTFATRTATSDASGLVPFSALDAGVGDTLQHFYRIISVSDGNVLYSETRFQDVPLAVTANYLPEYRKAYYVAGQSIQLLPATGPTTVQVACNYKPASLLDLETDNSTVPFPDNNHFIVVWMAAAQLLLKGGTEAGAAAQLRALADAERRTMLDDIRRRTIHPTYLAFPDRAAEWAGA